MRQLLYVSSKAPNQNVSIGNILVTSRRKNEAADVTGLLYTDGTRFLQVLEGAEAVVTATFDRIATDPRHCAVVVLSDRTVVEREFGTWSMAHCLPSDVADTFDRRLARLLEHASPNVRGTFVGMVTARRAA